MEIIIYDLTVGPYKRIISYPYLFHSVNRRTGYTDIFPDMYSSSMSCHQYRPLIHTQQIIYWRTTEPGPFTYQNRGIPECKDYAEPDQINPAQISDFLK